jgi:hypothetical protein
VWVGVLETAMAMAIALAVQRLIADSRLSGHFVEVSSGQNAGCTVVTRSGVGPGWCA